jgi:hypothetical protein
MYAIASASPLESPLLKRMCLSKTRNTMCLSENEQEGEKEEYDADNILTKEIDSWNNFEYALTEQ